jgi:thiamine biosynthesis lipoprotein
MGTTVTMTVLDPDREHGLEAIEAAFDEMVRVDRLMSTHRPESEVSRLNREGRIAAGPELRFVLERARTISEATSGAFDVTISPLLELFARSFRERGGPPLETEIESDLRLVDYRLIVTVRDSVILPAGMAISLGGIAKGYAVDLALAALAREGIKHALVNAGGDLGALGDRAGVPWRIAVQDPRDSGSIVATISLMEQTVATSGDYERAFDPEREWHHIIDPRTGLSATDLISVTVTAASALDADALATAVFVLGAGEGLELVEGLDGVEAILVTAGGTLLASTGMDYRLPREH